MYSTCRYTCPIGFLWKSGDNLGNQFIPIVGSRD